MSSNGDSKISNFKDSNFEKLDSAQSEADFLEAQFELPNGNGFYSVVAHTDSSALDSFEPISILEYNAL